MKIWKTWPYWLKGGVVGGGVGFFSVLLSPLFCSTLGLICFVLSIPTLPLFPFVETLALLSNQLLLIVIPIITTIAWFILGSILGWLVKSLKSKKEIVK